MNTPSLDTLTQRNTVLASQRLTLERQLAHTQNELKATRARLHQARTVLAEIAQLPAQNGFTAWEAAAEKMAALARKEIA